MVHDDEKSRSGSPALSSVRAVARPALTCLAILLGSQGCDTAGGSGGQAATSSQTAVNTVSASHATANSGASSADSASSSMGSQLSLASLAAWTRHPSNPVFGGTDFSGDAHVWLGSPKHYMVYTDSFADRQALAMATSSDLVNWTLLAGTEFANGMIMQGPGPGGDDIHLETPFYRKANDGRHQIFYIGYADQDTYHAAIYKAESNALEGPYEREATPVIEWTSGGPDAVAMTSPTIVDYNGTLYMSYLGWEGFPNGPVHTMGAISTTDGRSWTKQGIISPDDIFGVEAHIEKGPDGLFYRVGTLTDPQEVDEIFVGRASHPFGPYTIVEAPILTEGGPALGEGDGIVSPSLLFDDAQRVAYLHFASIDTGGFPWVTSLATCNYSWE